MLPRVQRRALGVKCDTDDFVALLTALGCGRFEVMGLTSIYGNAGVDQTTENALNLLKAIHHPHVASLQFSHLRKERECVTGQIPVYKGAKAPWNGLPLLAPVQVHGHNGVGNVVLPKSEVRVKSERAFRGGMRHCLAEKGRRQIRRRVSSGDLQQVSRRGDAFLRRTPHKFCRCPQARSRSPFQMGQSRAASMPLSKITSVP